MTEKTIADVLDKSIDRLSGGAAEIAKAAKQVAPHAWEVAVRQQVAEGWARVAINSLPFIACLGALVFVLTVGRKLAAKYCDASDGGSVVGAIMVGLIGFFGALWAGDNIADASLKIANPEYYAAKAILEAVK